MQLILELLMLSVLFQIMFSIQIQNSMNRLVKHLICKWVLSLRLLDLNTNIATDTTLTASLPGSPVVPADVVVLNVIGIEFYQQVNSEYYLFASGHAAKINNTF